MINLQALKNLQLDRMLELDEPVALAAEARALAAEYDYLDLPVPEWISQAVDILHEEIAKRTRAGQLAELKRLETEQIADRSQNERRSARENRMALLQKQLGLSKAKAAPVAARR